MPAVSSRGRGRRTIAEINMVPFIDVMLVLLIIFMVTAPMITPSMVDLPSVGKAAKQPDKVIQVVIQKDEQLELVIEGKTDTANLTNVAASVKTVKVMDSLQRAGVARVGLSVQLAP
jgi:biopolymer transport protein TolR